MLSGNLLFKSAESYLCIRRLWWPVDLLFRRNSLIAPYSFTMEKLLFVVRSLKVLNWESLLAIEQIVESKKTMKSIHTSWTIAFGNALIPFLSFFFFSRTCKKKQIPFLNGRGRGGTEQNKIPLYLSLGLCAFLNLSWVGLRRRVPREISSSSPKALVESK